MEVIERRDYYRARAFGLVDELATFANGHGEKFVFYRMGRQIYITGDELDWEIGWCYYDESKQILKHFELSENEAKLAGVAFKTLMDNAKT